MAKEALLLLKSWAPKNDPDVAKLRAGCGKCQVFGTQLTQVHDLHCLPNGDVISDSGLRKFLLEVASHTKEFNVLVETCKGKARAQRN